ncbi:MAG: hypothetical protein CM1200mP1_00440 [Candidatus Neomarinimicrobiota bacterium]|nr:MAG: hypothetical protein CM1200mP1_00440 [Candidatus Neomarinimicrobiota bacterium]
MEAKGICRCCKFRAIYFTLNEIIKEVHSVDLFCSNAGKQGHGKPFDASDDTWEAIGKLM